MGYAVEAADLAPIILFHMLLHFDEGGGVAVLGYVASKECEEGVLAVGEGHSVYM